MGYKVVREVTQPAHALDGTLTHRPGEQFGLDEPLPEGVPFRLTVAETRDKPKAAAQERPASRPARGSSAD